MDPSRSDTPTFSLGQMVITPNALDSLTQDDVQLALRRHAGGDWGNLDEHDRLANDVALEGGGRLFSAYEAADRTRFWVITEADRSATTILLPEDY